MDKQYLRDSGRSSQGSGRFGRLQWPGLRHWLVLLTLLGVFSLARFQVVFSQEQSGYDQILEGSDDDDLFSIPEGASGRWLIIDPEGEDTISFSSFDAPIVIDLRSSDEQQVADGLLITIDGQIEKIWGSVYDDQIIGNAHMERIEGLSGDDVIIGGEGRDYIAGGPGNDVLYGGDENDDLDGEDGDDILFGDGGIDTLYGGDGDDTLNGGADRDRLYGEMGKDTLNGDAGDDSLSGDQLRDPEGDDILNGDEGDDSLAGGDGADVYTGGPGTDVVYGFEGDLDTHCEGIEEGDDLQDPTDNPRCGDRGMAAPDYETALASMAGTTLVVRDIQPTVIPPPPPPPEYLVVEEIDPFISFGHHQEIFINPPQDHLVTTIQPDVSIISLTTGQQTGFIPGIGRSGQSRIFWSPDGTRIASHSRDELTVWDSGGQLLFSGSHRNFIDDLVWSPDSQYIYTQIARSVSPRAGEDDGDVGVWDAMTGDLLYVFGDVRNPSAIQVSPDGSLLSVLGGRDRWQIWRVDGTPSLIVEDLDSPGISTDRIVFGNQAGYVYLDGVVWDTTSGTPVIDDAPSVFEGNRALLGSDSMLFVGFSNVQTIDLAAGTSVVNVDFGHQVWGSIIAHDQARVLTWDNAGVTIWDAATGKELVVLKTPVRPSWVVWNSRLNLVTAIWRDDPIGINQKDSLLWRWDLSDEAIANGAIAITPSGDTTAPAASGGGDVVVDESDISCQISAAQVVNKRTGPGTSFARAGQMRSGDSQNANGQKTGPDRFVWWRLADDTWVRSDVVIATGDCEALPVIDG